MSSNSITEWQAAMERVDLVNNEYERRCTGYQMARKDLYDLRREEQDMRQHRVQHSPLEEVRMEYQRVLDKEKSLSSRIMRLGRALREQAADREKAVQLTQLVKYFSSLPESKDSPSGV